MPKTAITTDKAARPAGPYSQGIRAGDFLFVAGQGPIDPQTGELVGATIEEQTARTLENIKAILEAGGATMADVVKSTVHLSDMANFQGFNSVYIQYFPDPKPVRTTVGSMIGRIMVEIDVIAYLGD
jgi:2-iminobutanoate/2-iminopropanoate deaminase